MEWWRAGGENHQQQTVLSIATTTTTTTPTTTTTAFESNLTITVTSKVTIIVDNTTISNISATKTIIITTKITITSTTTTTDMAAQPIQEAITSPDLKLPLVDLSDYLNPSASLESKQRVIAEVRDACRDFGFFQVKGHGIPLAMQQNFLNTLPNFFRLPREDKVKLSFLQSPGRRGYEYSGLTLRDGDALPDSKEAFYVGHENKTVEPPGFHCPNLWPELPAEDFRDTVEEYYEATSFLGKLIWEILIQGLGHPAELVEDFSKKPVVMMKMIRYPAFSSTLAGQYGVGPHSDFGGVTVLLQQAEKEGLEVWIDEKEAWLPVPAVEDVYVSKYSPFLLSTSTRVQC